MHGDQTQMWRRRLFGAVALTVALSCGSPNAPKQRLEGSLSTVMDLGYDDAVLTFGGTEFSVLFKRKRGSAKGDCTDLAASCDTTLSVTSRLEQSPFPDGGQDALVTGWTYDLTEVLTSGLPRGVVSRNVLDDPRGVTQPFTTLRVGEIHFINVPQQGQNLKAAGDFHATFTNGVEFASGKTVFGSFQAVFP